MRVERAPRGFLYRIFRLVFEHIFEPLVLKGILAGKTLSLVDFEETSDQIFRTWENGLELVMLVEIDFS